MNSLNTRQAGLARYVEASDIVKFYIEIDRHFCFTTPSDRAIILRKYAARVIGYHAGQCVNAALVEC